ncbi:MAG: 2-C-methyl-D-erythritol 2,4-cyclodiphosphate synthase, partial [Eubacterium sp.]|nr:2-C-methyl-D-erythritol 2,4-cyclodiphosphate synthase [Eubacterium sp.]
VMDALLGAAALRDIGYHFPDTDPAYKGISSMKLLERVGEMLLEKFYVVENIDVTIIAQAPKLRPYIDQMIYNIADALRIDTDQVNVKATTEEGLGFTGAMEGISAQAVCVVASVLDELDAGSPGSVCGPGGCEGCPGCRNCKTESLG